MFRSIRTRALVVLLVLVTLSVSLSAGTPLIIPHQGRLLDAADTPLDGSYTITYSIFEAPTGGSPLWTESHAGVVVAKGLFSVQLGSIVPLTADILTGSSGSSSPVERYLEIQLLGQAPIAPRTQLGSSPYSVAASRVSGDILTSKGLAEVRDFSSLTDDAVVITSNPSGNSVTMRSLNGLPPGTPVIGALSMTTSPSSSSLDIGDLDGDGLYQVLATADSVSREITVTDNGPGGTALMKAKEKANRTKCSSNLRAMSPSSTNEIDESCDLMRATMKAIQTKGTGAIALARMDAGDSATISTNWDSDGNGDPESSMEQSSSSGRTVLKAIARGGSTTGTIRMQATPDSVLTIQGCDTDGDGVAESSYRIVNDGGGKRADVIIRGRSGSTTGTIRMAAKPDTTSSEVESDSDGDGNPESRGTVRTFIPVGIGGTNFGASSRMSTDSDDDGVEDMTAEMESYPDSACLRLNGLPPGTPYIGNLSMRASGAGASQVMSGHNGSTTGTIRMHASPDSTVLIAEGDADGDGMSDAKTGYVVGPVQGGQSFDIEAFCRSDSNDDGDADRSISSSCNTTGAKHAINTKGTGAQAGRTGIFSSTTVDSASIDCGSDSDGDGHNEAHIHVQVRDTYGNLAMSADTDNDGVAEVSAEMETSPDSASLRLNGLPPGVPVIGTISMTASPSGVHMAVGAATCDGTNWVNASDRNAKENFEKVDGEEILEQISELEITRWNYRGDENAQHIGPTAQDFKKAFGVGADDKSISTIDPSGIALAAIKELYAQIKERDKEHKIELQRRDEQIAKMQIELQKLREVLKKK